MITTRTASGVEVTLEGQEYCGRPVVRASCTAPKVGAIDFLAAGYGSPRGSKVRGLLGYHGSQQICLTVPEADYEAALAEARAIGERELADLREGRAPIAVRYHDGEYLSGWQAFGRAGKLLVGLGLAKDVDGWGTHVEASAVTALGESFTYAAAAEYARPALEAKGAALLERDAERRDRLAAAVAEARRTGRPVEVERWPEGCDGSQPECDLDACYRVALPDGSTRVERTHTH